MRDYGSKSMNRFYIFAALCFFAGGVFSAAAQDLITLKNGSVIEAKVVEVSPVEIKYKNFNHLDGPLIIIPADSVLSIKYENSINNTITIPITPGGASKDTPVQQSGTPTAIQSILNSLPAVSIARNNLKFEFSGETWIAKVNNENFSAGTITFEATADGGLLTLKQTHIWPGNAGKAAAKTAGRIASLIPGGSNVAGALETAGNIAGAVGALAGAIETSGTEMVLEYKAGPSASLRLVSTRNTAKETVTQNTHALFNRGSQAHSKGEYDAAIADFTEIIKIDSNNAAAYFCRGLAYTRKGDYDRAIADYSDSIKINPNNTISYINRGNAYLNKNDYDLAIADYNEAIRFTPNVAIYYNRGNAYYNKKDYNRAITDFEAALRMNPNHINARNNLKLAQQALRQ